MYLFNIKNDYFPKRLMNWERSLWTGMTRMDFGRRVAKIAGKPTAAAGDGGVNVKCTAGAASRQGGSWWAAVF